MFDKLKKLLEGGVAQVNPFDNGKTFQSVVNNRTPQQQNAVQQQQQQARVFNPARPQQAPQQNFTDKLRDILDANSQADKYRRAQMGQATSYQEQQAKAPNVYNQVAGAAEKFSRYHPLLNPMAGLNLANDASNAKIPGLGVSASQVAQQVPQAVQSLPKELPRIAKNVSDAQNSLAPMHIRDILDANTAEDIRKRTQAGEAAMYADQQKALGNKRPNQNIGAALLGGTARFANTAKAGYDEATDTGMLLLANQMYGDRGRDEMLRRINERQQSQYQPDSGIFGSGTWFNSPENFQKVTSDPLALIGKAAANVGETGLELSSMGLGSVENKLAEQGLKQFLKTGTQKAGARFGEGVVSDALGQTFTRDKFSPEQAITSGVAAIGLPIGVSGAGKVLRKGFNLAGGGKVIGALGRQFRKPRSVAEITQEVATARQPAIANNAPRTRVTPDGTILPPRPASEIAAELAASKARAADPNVQAKMASIKAAGQPSTPVKKINMTPDDQRILADFNDIANGVYKPDAKLQRKIELDATYIAEKYNIPLRSTPQEMAEEFDNVLQRGVTKPEFAPKPQQYNQLAPKPSKQDPLEALKAEARKYKSADEFVNSQINRPKPTDNVWQDTLPSGTRPDSVKKLAKSSSNTLYHDTTADGILGILDSGEIKASQAPFSSIAGQGKRVSTTRNFDNYSRYNKSPYRLVIDESKTGQRAIPDNREEFESVFRKGVSTKAVNSIAIDTTNPALLNDIRSGKLKSVIESAKKKGITIEPFEGKVLPNEGANAEVQTMTSRAFSKAFPEYKTRISQLTDLYNQAHAKPKIYADNYTGPLEIPSSNRRTIDSYSTPKPVTEYKVGERVSNATSQGGTVDGTIVKTPDFSKDLRYKGNHFEVKLSDGTIIKTDGAGFDNPTTPSKSYTGPKATIQEGYVPTTKTSNAPKYGLKRPELEGKLSPEDAMIQAGIDSGHNGLAGTGKGTKYNAALSDLTKSQREYVQKSASSYYLSGDPVFQERVNAYARGSKPTPPPKPGVTQKPKTAFEQNVPKSYTEPKPLISKDSLAPNGRVKTAEVDNVFNSLPDGTVGEYGFVKKNGKIYPPNDANITPEVLKKSFIDLNPDGSVKEGFGMTKMSFLDGVKDPTASPKPKVTAKPTAIEQNTGIKTPTSFEQNTGVVAPTRAKATSEAVSKLEAEYNASKQALDSNPAAPKAPITEQIAPNEIKISSAIEKNKPGIKARTQEVREQLVNRFAPVEDLVSKIEKETGAALRPSKNPLSYVRQYLGGGGIANAKIDNELTPIIKQTKEFDGLREYLVAKRMNELADRGMSKRADDVLEGINQKYGAEVGNFEKVAKELYAYQNRQLDELVDVGVLTREAADNIRAKNQYYVPFNRVMPELEDFAGTAPANAIGRNGNPIKAIHGSDKDIIDPIESMIRNTYDIQATVQKQKVMRSLRDLAPDEFTVPAKASLNKNRVGMFVDGEKVILETSEPLARALNSMAEEQMNMAVKVMSLPAKALRSGATSLNVAFALPNVLRDQLSAAVNSKYGGIPVYDFVSGLASVINKDDSYKKWIMSGADQASFFAQDRTTLQRGVKDITGGAAYKVGKLVKSPLELFRIIGQFSEEGSRVGVYKRALKGATKEFGNLEDATLAAAKESREATIDFARRGSKMKAANALIPFLNARLQGTLKLANSFRERPVQTGAVGMAIAGLPAAALYLHNSQYPEYSEIPDYVRRENFIIMTGNKNTPFIKIPKGEVGKIFGNPVESFLAQMSSEDPEWKSTVGTLVDSFLPVGSVEDPGKFVTDLMPTAASVPLQMTANFDTFRGMPIVSQWQKDLPPEQQFSNYNTETGKKIGAALGVSPAMLEFGIGGITGGLGRQALQLGDIATGNKVPTQDLPVISRFAGEQKDLSKSAGEVYDQLDKDRRETARDNYKLKQAIKSGDLSGIEGMDKTKANRLVRSVKEDEIKKTLSPTEKALWGMSKEDLESYEGKYGKEASKVLELKNSLNTSKEAKTNKEKYEQALEKFNDPDNGYSKVEKIKKTEELKRLTVQKDYDEDTTMLHGMSKEDVWGFLSTYEDGKAAADKLLALDDALTAAGVQDKNKFRDKYGNIAIKPKEKSSGKGGSKAKTVKGQAEAVSSERKLRALLANTNNKTSYRKPATQSAKVGLKKFAVKSAGITSRKGA